MFGLGKRSREAPPDLEERVRKLEREMKDLQLEWQTVYDKLYRQAQRNARTKIIDEGVVGGEIGVPPSQIPALSRAERLQAIRLRRMQRNQGGS